jgi:hypothetical protein
VYPTDASRQLPVARKRYAASRTTKITTKLSARGVHVARC